MAASVPRRRGREAWPARVRFRHARRPCANLTRRQSARAMSAAIEIHVISDSTGDTAARVARAAQAQFSAHPTTLIRHPRVTTVGGIAAVFDRIRPAAGVAVFYTLIDRELRRAASDLCERRGIAGCDLLGPVLET